MNEPNPYASPGFHEAWRPQLPEPSVGQVLRR